MAESECGKTYPGGHTGPPLKPAIQYTTTAIWIIVVLLLLQFSGCNSTSLSEDSSSSPSSVSGTVFENPLEYDAGGNPTTMVEGDWDSDNLTDLMLVNPRKQSGTLSTENGALTRFLRQSSGAFLFTDKSELKPATAQWRQHLLAADFTGDNQTDLVVTLTGQDNITLLLNSAGTFSDNSSTSVGDVPVHLAAGDWNSDNYTDISVVNRGGATVSILLNDNGSGAFTTSQTLTVGATPLKAVTGDWDKDSDTDLAVLSSADNQIGIWINTGGSFSKNASQPAQTGDSPRDLISGDWNCDDLLDLAASNFGSNTLSLYYGNGDGTFSGPSSLVTGIGPVSIDTADFNQDNLSDFVVAHRFFFSTSSMSHLTGDFGLLLSQSKNGSGQVSYADVALFASTTAPDGSPPADVKIMQADNDSKLDVLLTLPVHQKLSVLSGKTYSGQLVCP